ncbi:MAG: ComEC/Rec2 family competence protein [Patescibacteria group bacterium]
MHKNHNQYVLLLLAFFFLIIAISLFYIDLKKPQNELVFSMLDVGQGDALFIQSPTGTQILVDGGSPGKLMGELRRVIPLFDRSIDLLIITNPDSDHIGGFLDVVKRYKVGGVMEPGTVNDSSIYKSLEDSILKKKIPVMYAKKGMKLDIGGGAFIDILFPDRDVTTWSTNDGSIVAKLTYGGTSILLTGDMTRDTEKIILSENSKEFLDVDILKVAHHGSRSSSYPDFIDAVSPKYSLISVGGDNKYGHPHKDVLDTLAEFNTQVFRTDLLGTITIRSDGLSEFFTCDIIKTCEIKK